MSKNVLRTVLVNDTHCGHDLGLKSDKAIHKDKPSEFASKTQEVLWEAWKEFTKKYKNPDCLVLNGDIVDLLSIRNREDEMWTKIATEMKNDALRLIRMFGKPKRIIVLKGTPAHVDAEHVNLEKDIADDLDAHMYRFRRLHNFAIINLAPPEGVKALYHITHHMPSTSGWHRGTAPSKAMVSMMLNESHFIDRKVWGKITGIIRAHVHHYWYEESDNRRMIVNPCWQGATGWMIQKMPETPPDIGSIVLDHFSDGAFHKERFKVPVEKLRPPVFQA